LRNGAGQFDVLVQRANRTYKMASTPLGKEVVVILIKALRLGLGVWEYGNNFEQQHWKKDAGAFHQWLIKSTQLITCGQL
jgi:hypothetical protein